MQLHVLSVTTSSPMMQTQAFPVLVSSNLESVLLQAKHANKLGFPFDREGDGVVVSSLGTGVAYSRTYFEGMSGKDRHLMCPVIMERRKDGNGDFIDIFHEDKIRSQYLAVR